MTKAEQNQIIKEAWTRNLQKDTEIPEDIGNVYKNWVRNLVLQASQQLQQEMNSAQEQKEAS